MDQNINYICYARQRTEKATTSIDCVCVYVWAKHNWDTMHENIFARKKRSKSKCFIVGNLLFFKQKHKCTAQTKTASRIIISSGASVFSKRAIIIYHSARWGIGVRSRDNATTTLALVIAGTGSKCTPPISFTRRHTHTHTHDARRICSWNIAHERARCTFTHVRGNPRCTSTNKLSLIYLENCI